MIRLASAALLIVALSASTPAVHAEDWTMSRHDNAQTGATPESIKLPLSIAWEYGAARFPGNPSSPSVVGGVVYFASGDRIYAVDAATGALKWRYPAEQQLNSTIKGSPLVADGKLYIGASDGNLYAINAETGKYLWAYATRGAIRGSAVMAEGVIYIGSDDDSLHAIDSATGEPKWGGGFRTLDDVAMTPIVASGLVIFASQDSNIYAANAVTGKVRWLYRVPAAVKIPPVAAGDHLILGAGNSLVCLALRSGQQRWSVPLPSDPSAAPAVGNGVIYVPCKNRKLYALTTAGKSAWPEGVDLGCDCVSPPTLADDTLFVACERGLLTAYSAANGRTLWRIGLMPSLSVQGIQYANASSSPVVSNGALYALTDDGTLRCLRPDAVDTVGPEIYNMAPQRGVVISGSPPVTFSANFFDTTTGVDPATVLLTVDGDPVEYKLDAQKWLVTYQTPVTQPVRPLPDGRHDIALTAADWRGNSATEKWSFMVDTSLKPQTAPRPVEQPGQTARPTTPGTSTRRQPRSWPTRRGQTQPTPTPTPSPRSPGANEP